MAQSTASSKYRSVNDPSSQTQKQFLLVDTPGHGKLRINAFEKIVNPHELRGIIFIVDSANLTTSNYGNSKSDGLKEAAEFLHDILLQLQTRLITSKSSRAPKEMPILIAANKLDLFTALPALLVKNALEREITKVRSSRAKGLLASGVGMSDTDLDCETDWLGDGGEGPFEFSQMRAVNVFVTIEGGCVLGADTVDVKKWWDWIGSHL